jgi:PAS domain S-box-containing protein
MKIPRPEVPRSELAPSGTDELPAVARVARALGDEGALSRIIFDNSPFPMAIVSGRTGRHLAVNPAAERLLGRSADEIIGKTDAELGSVSNETQERLSAELAQSGRLELIRSKLQLRSREAHLLVSVVPLQVAGEPCFLASSIDVTAQHETEQALRASEQRFRALFESAPDGYVVCDASGVILDCNSAAETVLGRPRAEQIGVQLRTMGLAVLSQWPSENAGQPYERTYERPDGSRVCIEVRQAVIAYEPAPLGLVILRDVTLQKDQEATRERLERQLQGAQRLEAVGRLAGGIAHDFNNVLTAILGFSELLLGEDGDADSRRRDLLEIRRAAERAGGLTKRLLAFSRNQVIEPVIVDLNQLVGDALRMLERLIGEDVELVVHTEPALCSVLVDAGQLEQVLVNLVVNARDAMPSGGRLTISTANVTLDETQSRAFAEARPGEYVRVRVADTGCGMARDVLPHVFEPFFTTKPPGKGTGLGLAMVYGFVRQSGGFVGVSSEEGRGTSIDVYLPRYSGPRRSLRPRDSREGERRSATVLVVEDEEMLRTLVKRHLTRRGYKVLAARNADEAEALLDSSGESIDLLLTDIVLPGRNGVQLFEAVREQRPHLRVLYMSGYTDHPLTLSGEGSGGVPVLPKPFALELLSARVGETLAQ